jgi:hypothetical protein
MTASREVATPWRAVCGESRTHGSEGGVGKQACDHVGQPKRPAPTLLKKSFSPTGFTLPISAGYLGACLPRNGAKK